MIVSFLESASADLEHESMVDCVVATLLATVL